MSCEYIPSAHDQLAYPMESKYIHQAYPPDNALGLEHAYLIPPELSFYAMTGQQPFPDDQLYYNYLSPLNMVPQAQHDVPISPRTMPSYQLQLSTSMADANSQWASFDPDFSFPGTSSHAGRGSLPSDQLLYPHQQTYDPYVSGQPIHVHASTSVPPPRGPGEQWSMSGSLDPSNNMLYRSAEHPRLRTAQACEKCRARKAKCSGEHPACARCMSRGLICEYAPERRMRGPNKPKSKSHHRPSTSSGSPASSISSRRSSIVSLPAEMNDVKPEIDIVLVRTRHSPPPRPASSGTQRRKPRPPPLNLGTTSNLQQRMGLQAIRPMPQHPNGWKMQEEDDQMTIRSRADVPVDVGSAMSGASFASDVDMGTGDIRDILSHTYPMSSVRDGAGNIDVSNSAFSMAPYYVNPSMHASHNHGRSLSSGATDVTPIFLEPRNVQQQRLSIPTDFYKPRSSGIPSPSLQYPDNTTDGVHWTLDSPFCVSRPGSTQ